MLKSDDENQNGDTQMLCKLFSGEQCKLNFATEEQRNLPDNVPFSIAGSTQVKSMALILSQLDNGNGIIDRFLMLVPNSMRPLPAEQIAAMHMLHSESVQDIADIYSPLLTIDSSNSPIFFFSDDAQSLYEQSETDYWKLFNDCLLNGRPTPKSKFTDFIPRLAVSLHNIEQSYNFLKSDRENDFYFKEEISINTLNRAIYLLDIMDQQKDTFTTFIQQLVIEKKKKEKSYTITGGSENFNFNVQWSCGKLPHPQDFCTK